MTKRFILLLLLGLGLAGPLRAQPAADPPPDPACPRGDRELPRGPDWHCYGRLNKDYSFAFVYPKAVERVPELDFLVRTEAAVAEAWIAEQVLEAQLAGREHDPMSYQAAWEIDAVLPEIAAASGTISYYTGGAHGGIEYKTILLDRRRGRTIALADLFAPGTFDHGLFGQRGSGMRAVQAAFCRALAGAVRERRGDPAAAVECPAVEAQPVTLVCGALGRVEAFRTLLNPYIAGSWAEGPYEVEFPVDALMMASMKRRFRPAFGVGGESRPRVPARPCR